MNDLLGQTGAEFSPCRKLRLRLWRVWDASLPRAVFILINPSKADEIRNDPTIERLQRRVMQWAKMGYLTVGGIEVVNLFAYRETDSRLLPSLHASGIDLVGVGNDEIILQSAKKAGIVICGWGNSGTLGGRDQAVLRMLSAANIPLHALEINKDGTPKHPLYIGYSAKPIPLTDLH